MNEKGSGVDSGSRPALADHRLLTRALRLGWPVPAEMKAKAVERMGQILEKSTSGKAHVSASRVLLGMENAEAVAIQTAFRVSGGEVDAALKAIEEIKKGAEIGRKLRAERKPQLPPEERPEPKPQPWEMPDEPEFFESVMPPQDDGSLPPIEFGGMLIEPVIKRNSS